MRGGKYSILSVNNVMYNNNNAAPSEYTLHSGNHISPYTIGRAHDEALCTTTDLKYIYYVLEIHIRESVFDETRTTHTHTREHNI